MKDENGIDVYCKNCNDDVAINCPHYNPDNPDDDWGCVIPGEFVPSYDALFARIAELQKELYVVQESERVEAQEADRLRAEVKELGKKLTETIKLLSENSRECGKLEAEVKVLKAFVIKVHTSPVIFEDVNRALRDEAKTLLEKLNQSAESEK